VDPSLPPERLLGIIQTQNDIIATALDLDAVMRLVAARAQALTGASAAVVEIAEGDDMVYHAACGAAAEFIGVRVPVAASLSGLCLRVGEILYCRDARTDGRINREAALRVGAISMLCVPLRHRARTVGVLKVYAPTANAFTPEDLTTLSLLSGVIAAHMAHAAEFEVQRHESRHDALTGLPNWRAFDERLGAEIARVRRHGGALAVAMLDLDGFKARNDSLGHAAGDALLRAVARHFDLVREEDMAFRLGGDEFALLLIGASESDAGLVVSRIEAAIAADPDCQGVSVSGGVAGLRSVDSSSGLLARADAAMYAAKRARRAGAHAAGPV